MDCRVLPSRQLPHQPKLFLDYLERFERVKAFYAYPPTMQAVSREARKLSYPSHRRSEVAALLRAQNVAFGAGAETISNLERLEEGAVAVVTGQQVGLFSGPPYSVYKALMAVQIAEELTRSGIPAVPVFWMATEDHDLEEVRQTTWFDRGKLIRFELPVTAEAGRPVGQIPLGREAGPLVHEAAELLANQGSDLLAQNLIESYGPEETYGSAFGKLFARLFAEQGLILMDPLDQGLHKVAAPLYQHALAEVIYRELLGRMPVMLPRAGFTLVDAKANKLLRRYGLTVEDVWAGSQNLRHKMEGAAVPKSLSRIFERNKKQIAKMLAQLGKQIEKLDPTLKGTVERSRKRIEFHIEKLRRKAGRAQDQKTGLISAHEQCLLPFLARWGAGGLSELQKHATGKALGRHFIVPLP